MTKRLSRLPPNQPIPQRTGKRTLVFDGIDQQLRAVAETPEASARYGRDCFRVVMTTERYRGSLEITIDVQAILDEYLARALASKHRRTTIGPVVVNAKRMYAIEATRESWLRDKRGDRHGVERTVIDPQQNVEDESDGNESE